MLELAYHILSLIILIKYLQIMEGQLKLRYSGGAGKEAGYCRVSSVTLSVEMLPSVQITNWDVLPAET
jgi:hypothetical protein